MKDLKVIAIANQKGGVAKTTTTHNLGVALATKGKRVLLIDLDSQASLTISVGLEPLEVKRTIVDVLRKDGVPVSECIEQISDQLHIVTSSSLSNGFTATRAVKFSSVLLMSTSAAARARSKAVLSAIL